MKVLFQVLPSASLRNRPAPLLPLLLQRIQRWS